VVGGAGDEGAVVVAVVAAGSQAMSKQLERPNSTSCWCVGGWGG